jgi:DNA-binding CsgD family transcriptional regulator
MPARNVGGLFISSARGTATAAARWLGRGVPPGRLALSVLLTVIVATAVAWFIDRRVTEVMLAELVARASDQVELGVLPRVAPADFEPPYTLAKLDALDARLDSILDRARESGSGVIRVNLYARDGTVLYSDLASLRGQVVSPLADPLLAAALAGSAGAGITSLTRQEDADLGPRYGTAMEAYVPCILDGRVAGAYELYTEPGPLWPMRWAIWASLGVGFTLVLCGIVMLTRGTGGSPVSAKTSGVRASIRPPLVIRTGLVRLDPAGESAVEGGSPPGADAGIHALVNSASECWLSRRETEVLRLLATNRTYREIAGELSVSEETVRSHVKSILHKLGQPDRTRAVVAAVQAGILPELSPAL